ncbi:biotin carboxylase N-terminal domain-containing protein [Arthrobacter sp. LAPM80]|uniref:acetyl/propionyl/methylcrotonyl-CoA carboxylase subunit alpha n=1 Tax=Arthrobacter sp. LAPM80 TaxID=3141788 RepID=UPI00398BACB1
MQKVLIANRGEIAVRIARACEDMGIAWVGVYSDADADALHVRGSTEAYALQGNSPAESYLNIPKLLTAARLSGADAVHPGYGFLSENADFAEAVQAAGLTWIGPSPESIRILGNKVSARAIAQSVGAPMVPGSDGPVEYAAEVREFAAEHGLPIVIKAAFGGGGRGLKVVWEEDAIEEAFDSAVRESVVAFGRGECFVERFLANPRHIEAQVLADNHGNVIVAGTRDCSLQRRNQKLVEEAPAPFLTEAQLERIHSSAKAICRAAGYTSAGTVEYLVAQDGAMSFLEVNTRLQVEHTITEETSGIDLVQAQLAIAAGEKLASTQDCLPRGHSFEFRINAEDPGRGFLPAPGALSVFTTPTGPGVRIDSGYTAGDTVPGHYDSLLAKLIVTGVDREQALRRARRALAEFRIEGVATVLPFHRAVVESADFTGSERFGVHTNWIETEFVNDIPADTQFPIPLAEAQRHSFFIDVDGRRVQLGMPTELLSTLIGFGAGQHPPTSPLVPDPATSAEVPEDALLSGIAGTVVKWLVDAGSAVSDGEPVVILEAMKMETTVAAHRSGILGSYQVQVGESTVPGLVLAMIADPAS